MFAVTAGELWPRIFETVTRGTPSASISVVAVCRRSWKRIWGSSARFSTPRKWASSPEIKIGPPVSEVKTRLPHGSRHLSPRSARSACHHGRSYFDQGLASRVILPSVVQV